MCGSSHAHQPELIGGLTGDPTYSRRDSLLVLEGDDIFSSYNILYSELQHLSRQTLSSDSFIRGCASEPGFEHLFPPETIAALCVFFNSPYGFTVTVGSSVLQR